MSSQRYQRVADEETDDNVVPHSPTTIPNSPPPSFRSHASSRRPSRDEIARSAEERSLEDAFEPPSDDDDDDTESEDARDRRRLIASDNSASSPAAQASAAISTRPGLPDRATTQLPTFTSSAPSGRVVGSSHVNDGVFANLNAKPRAGEDLEEKPPTYEQAAADATPPYWETTILSPYAHSGNPDDVFVDGLLVGSFFSFIWNMLISMSFQLPGFLLTYLLHTTHAAKHGSRSGLGITLIQYGFQMRYSASLGKNGGGGAAPEPGKSVDGIPDHPDSHTFDPASVAGAAGGAGAPHTEWLSYALMIAGWFILIRAVMDFLRARRQEALVRSSPDRGLGVAVVAENEAPETSV